METTGRTSPPTSAQTTQTTGCAKLDADLAAFRALIAFTPQNADTLEAELGKVTTRLVTADLAGYDIAGIKAEGDHALDDLFLVRVALRDRIPDWRTRGLMTPGVERNLRGVFRVGRYATDMLAELILSPPVPKPGDDLGDQVAFTGHPLATAINPKYRTAEGFDFRSGDVLLVRGSLSTSAAIARIGDIDSQFSHIGLVHVDRNQHASIVEALIEKGSVTAPLQTALDHGLGRAVLFRPRDPELAGRAANFILDHVRRSNMWGAEDIPYDFSMELEGENPLYCSKLIRLAYAKGSQGAVILPAFPTYLAVKNRDFLNRIGVTADKTFAPGDVELDPHFDVVAEWRDVRKTSYLRVQDAMMDKHFAWMDTYGYVYRETFPIWLLSIAGRISAFLPGIIKRGLMALGLPEVPTNMKRRTIAAIAMLTFTTGRIAEGLNAHQRDHRAKTGRPLHMRDLYAWLEAYREQQGNKIGYLQIPRR